jgi:hypothetical protein
MTDAASITGYSPPIRITLEVDGMSFDVAEVGPDHVTLRSPRDCGPMQAVLVVDIDGRIKRRQLMLPEGILKGRDRQLIIRLETASLAKAS